MTCCCLHSLNGAIIIAERFTSCDTLIKGGEVTWHVLFDLSKDGCRAQGPSRPDEASTKIEGSRVAAIEKHQLYIVRCSRSVFIIKSQIT